MEIAEVTAVHHLDGTENSAKPSIALVKSRLLSEIEDLREEIENKADKGISAFMLSQKLLVKLESLKILELVTL